MSAVQSCLESKEMASSNNVNFLESFTTIEEEKDSDEESFHLFLDGDDELNKSDDKSQCNEVEEDANVCNEEKDEVNEPSTIEPITEHISTDNEEKSPQENIAKTTEDDSNQEKSMDKHNRKFAEQSIPTSKKDEAEMRIEIETPDSKVLEPTETNDIQYIENSNANHVETSENVNNMNHENGDQSSFSHPQKKTEEPSDVISKEIHKGNDSSFDDEIHLTVENEDEILNRHANITETTEAVEDLDPILEESLLDEGDTTEIDSTSLSETILESKMTDDEEGTHSQASKPNGMNDKTSEVNAEKCSGDLGNSVSVVTVDQEELVQISESESKFTQDKCDDNSNGSTPSDTEDLLDISMIKDSAQDDADIAEDALQLEQENDDLNGNTDNRSSKVNGMDHVDDSSNLDNSDEEVKDDFVSENQETVEAVQNSFTEIDSEENQITDENTEKELEEIHVEENNSTEDEHTINGGMKLAEGKNKDDNEDQSDVFSNESNIELNDHSINADKVPSKRTLSDETLESEPKKIKLTDEMKDENDEIDNWDITELNSLISFSKFMTKSHLKQLTRADLEEFCIQKLCEAILHKSELGETNHQLKIQEQTIENLRKEQTVLTKQIKDLEIVNKKLMHEVRCNTGSKPIVPVKITRSVGLQVRLVQPNDPSVAKRRPNQVTPQKQQSNPTTPNVNNRSPRVTQSPTVNRQVLTKSPQKPATPILNQVLQTRNTPTSAKTISIQNQNNATPRPNLKSKATPEKRPKTSGSFIDLTEEDDKKTNKVQNSLKAIVPQGVRINSIPKTTIPSVLSSVVSSSTPQVMYVVQSNSQIKQGLLTTPAGQQKAVLVNFQPTNGVIGSLNNSSVSVIPKVAGNVQLRTSGTLVKIKHPAPLPNPPQVQGPTNKNLKGIPPKPELSIRKTNTGIILQWRMPYDLGLYEGIASYQLYAYQETSAPPSTDTWRKVGDVKAMALPMACTLTQFPAKNKYFFAVRPVDIHKRIGRFSDPEEISL